MEYTFIIHGRLSGLNELIAYNRTNMYKGAQLKRDSENLVMTEIKRQLHGLHIEKQVLISYAFYEPNTKRDHDNVASFAMKVIQDALVRCGVLNNDGWKEIRGFSCDFNVDQKNPRIVVTLEEVE